MPDQRLHLHLHLHLLLLLLLLSFPLPTTPYVPTQTALSPSTASCSATVAAGALSSTVASCSLHPQNHIRFAGQTSSLRPAKLLLFMPANGTCYVPTPALQTQRQETTRPETSPLHFPCCRSSAMTPSTLASISICSSNVSIPPPNHKSPRHAVVGAMATFDALNATVVLAIETRYTFHFSSTPPMCNPTLCFSAPVAF